MGAGRQRRQVGDETAGDVGPFGAGPRIEGGNRRTPSPDRSLHQPVRPCSAGRLRAVQILDGPYLHHRRVDDRELLHRRQQPDVFDPFVVLHHSHVCPVGGGMLEKPPHSPRRGRPRRAREPRRHQPARPDGHACRLSRPDGGDRPFRRLRRRVHRGEHGVACPVCRPEPPPMPHVPVARHAHRVERRGVDGTASRLGPAVVPVRPRHRERRPLRRPHASPPRRTRIPPRRPPGRRRPALARFRARRRNSPDRSAPMPSSA